MDEPLKISLALAYGYLVGSVPTAYIIARLVKGIDLRKHGSGNIGAANVWYNVGKGWIFPLGIFDLFVKGPTPVWLARHVLDLDMEAQVAAGLLAVVGHNWPVFLGFRGGRGIAPMVGVLFALARMELTLFIVVAVTGWRVTNNSALWVLMGLLLLPVWAVVWDRPGATIGLMGGLIAVTGLKRLASNEQKDASLSWPRVLFNRFLFDRDIADHDEWVRRGPRADPG